MIDIHTHLLPGVDDGSRSIEASVSVLERFSRDGVEIVVCTPHLDASEAGEAPHERNADLLAALTAAAPATPRLLPGFEILLDAPGVDLGERQQPKPQAAIRPPTSPTKPAFPI